jgi:hypothetical protein
MPSSKLFVTLALGLVAAACQNPVPMQTVLAPAPLTSSEQACLDYGFPAGTPAYDRCVSREHQARLEGRVVPGSAETQLVADARDACSSYGLQPGTATYDRCVTREMEARRYRSEAAQVYVPTTPPPAAPYVETRNSNTAGVETFRDEYGFRYDAQGNRLDRYGNIISPQSTTP